LSTIFKLGILALAIATFAITAVEAYTIDISYYPEIGDYLVNEDDLALYYYEGDPGDETCNCCNETCTKKWPPFYAVTIEVPDELNPSDFTTIIREDGELQTTYKGYPLYLYQDDEPGEISGDDVDGMQVVDPTRFPPE
jgi:predicted lipoprotein with Yx(FWY)xxD motif